MVVQRSASCERCELDPSALALLGALVALAVTGQRSPPTRAVLFHLHDTGSTRRAGSHAASRRPASSTSRTTAVTAARFFAVDASRRADARGLSVPNAVNHDWEDLAVAPDAAGTRRCGSPTSATTTPCASRCSCTASTSRTSTCRATTSPRVPARRTSGGCATRPDRPTPSRSRWRRAGAPT